MKLPPLDTHFKPKDWDTYQLTQYTRAVALCKHRRVAIDCGGHVGIMTHRMATDFETVHVFEPAHMQYLKENTTEYSNIEYYERAVSNESTTHQMTVNHSNTGDYRLSAIGHIVVETITIDELNIPTVDLVKLDIQDSEYPALLGAERTITLHHPVIMIEIEPTNPHGSDCMQLLSDWGYSIDTFHNADQIWYFNG